MGFENYKENSPEVKKEGESLDKINELKLRKAEIISFKDLTADDRRILEEIDEQISNLQSLAKENLFKIIESHGGAYSPSFDKDYSVEEIKNIIDRVLDGRLDIKEVPRSPIMGTTENLRDKVIELMNLN